MPHNGIYVIHLTFNQRVTGSNPVVPTSNEAGFRVLRKSKNIAGEQMGSRMKNFVSLAYVSRHTLEIFRPVALSWKIWPTSCEITTS